MAERTPTRARAQRATPDTTRRRRAATGRVRAPARCAPAAGALMALLALLAGVPAALAVAVGNPLSAWGALRAGDVSDTVILDVLAALAWLAWAQFALTVAQEALALVRRVPVPHRHGIGAGQQQVARALVTAIAIALPAAITVPAVAAPQSVGVSTATTSTPLTPTGPASGPTGSTSRSPVTEATTAMATTALASTGVATHVAPTPSASSVAPESRRTPAYVIQAEGPATFWDLAQTFLGEGERWREIWDLNAGRRQDDGTLMRSAGLLRVGWSVRLPGADPAPTPGPSTLLYQVAPGDWLAVIADRYLGDAARYPQIRVSTADQDGGQQPPAGDHIEPGWVLVLPAGAHDRGPRRHARGAAHRPDEAAPRRAPKTGTAPGTPAPTTPAPTWPTPSPPPFPATATSAGAPATTSPSAPPTGAVRAPASAAADGDRDIAGPAEQPGVDLPGGWLGLPLAAALLAATTILWRRRRHHYRYTPIATDHDPQDDLSTDPHAAAAPDEFDPDLRPLPAVVTLLRRAVREHAADLAVDLGPGLDPPTEPGGPARHDSTVGPRKPQRSDVLMAPPHRPRHVTEPGPARIEQPQSPGRAPGHDIARTTAAHEEPAWAGTLAGLGAVPATGLGLSGPGALAAARALLVSAIAAGPPRRPRASGEIITTVPTLSALLAGSEAAPGASWLDPGSGTLDRVRVTPSPQEALADLEQRLLARRRAQNEDDEQPRQPATGPTGHDRAPRPPLLLLMHAPTGSEQQRLSAALSAGTGLGIEAVMIGPWPSGLTLQVAADGHTTGPDGTRRIAVVDASAARDLLEVLAEAHPPRQERRVPPDLLPPPTAPVADPMTAGPASAPAGPPAAHPGARGVTRRVVPADARVPVTLFGRPTVWDREGGAGTHLRRHARELLVYLALHRSGVRLPVIMELFWPDATVRRASQRLSTDVANLRHVLRVAAGDRDAQPVVNTGGRYHLDAGVVTIDVWDLQDHLTQAGDTIDPGSRALALRAAVAAHTGVLAEGHDYDWIYVHREQLRRDGIRARLALAGDSQTGPREGATLLTAAADLDSTNEDVAQRAIQALNALGDTEGARRRFDLLQSALATIDEEAAPTTVALLNRTLATRTVR